MTIVPWLGVVLGSAAAGAASDRPAFPFFEPVQPPRAIQVMAHRGAMNQAPENTAQALEFSIADGVEWVEVDVRLTKDGHHVLFHDGDLRGKTDGSGPVRDRTLAEIRALDAGSPFARRFAGARFLTLAEGLALARGRVNLYLDLKDVDPVELAREVIAAKMARQVAFYDKPAVLKAIRRAATEELAVMTKWRPRFGVDRWVEEVRPAAVEIDAGDVTPEACREFRRRGIKVQAKVLGQDDRPEVWDRMAAAGVDWLQTDRAEEILARLALKTTRGRRPKISYHRGAARYAPENTLPALEKALRLGADFIEFDVRTTRDGKHVLFHDGTLDRTTDGRGAVRDHTEAEIRTLDAGPRFGRPFRETKVPGLDEFLQAAGQRVELYVDAKDIAPKALAEVLSRHGLIERAVVYQHVEYLEELRRIDPRIRRMPPLRDPAQLDAVVERVRPSAFDTQWSILSKELIDRCHAKGVQVFSDALGQHESIAHYQRAIRDGVDAIQTDYPLRVLRAIELSNPLAAASSARAEAAKPESPFADRGYYITAMRMPTYDLAAWKRIVNGIHDEGGNLLFFWIAGAFRSKTFPITWKYNQDHENVRRDFTRELIDYAHTKGVRVLLGFTPFGYDGVNQYPLEHAELKAVAQDGTRVGKAGIGCWGYNLCPSREESQHFMTEYIREMAFDFYPNADGLLIESSDYAICHCKDCGGRFFEREFAFVKRISEEVWAKKPEAMVVVYPHYFSGATVPGFGVRAARLPFDPRWTLFFTPHSAHLDPALIRQARHSLWWDDSPALRRPQDIQAGARRALQAGVTGYVPSLEAYSFLATEAEEGQAWLKGRRQVPLGFGWLKPGEPPYDELPMRVNRIAYREFSRDPDLSFEVFQDRLGREVFGATTAQAVSDLLELQAAFVMERTWCRSSPLACPDRARAMIAQGTLTPAKRAEYRTALDRIRAIEERHRRPKSNGEDELHRIARWVLEQWGPENRRMLEDGR